VPTDELAGDALGFYLLDDRYLVSYVVDVTGHGVPAALLAVTVMHAMSPTGEGASLLRAPLAEGGGTQRPSRVIAELNRRFCAGDNDGRFLTMVLCILDTQDGRMRFARAGHPLPVVVRAGECLSVSDEGGPPLGVVDIAEFEDAEILLRPGDRVCLYSDGVAEQPTPGNGEQYGDPRFRDFLAARSDSSGERLVEQAVQSLIDWAGGRSFVDDVSIVLIDWLGGRST
jgi:sigma-B regulation protein RsbU (phosphoserine phosphatase)